MSRLWRLSTIVTIWQAEEAAQKAAYWISQITAAKIKDAGMCVGEIEVLQVCACVRGNQPLYFWSQDDM